MARPFLPLRLAVLWLALAAAPAAAQVATLLADNVDVSAGQVITASGNVEVLFEGTRLRASKIVYDAGAGELRIEGPITLIQDENMTVVADAATLDADLRNGIMLGARMVLDQQLQLAAGQISRVGGRYTQLYKTRATSCRVCAGKSVPMWSIRSEKVIHDQQERQLYFVGAELMVGNLPVLRLPRLRVPDPSNRRATGFLVPRMRTTSLLGTGLKVPYFITLGDSADITLTPYLSPKTTTVELRYRQAFRSGEIEFNTALTSDDLRPGEPRAYLMGTGAFSLARGYELGFDIGLTSDPAYLLDYGYSGTDRLQSDLTVTRTRADEYVLGSVTALQSLRPSELAIQEQLPNLRGEALYQRRFFPRLLGGQGMWQIGAQAHARASTADQLGRDVLRLGAGLEWSRAQVLGNGMVARAGLSLEAAAYSIAQDSTYPRQMGFIIPTLEAELRWPLVSTASRAPQLLEPVLQLAWSRDIGTTPPNEDSTLVEFDEGNLTALSRFPGEDRAERGLRAAAGLRWARYDPAGWSIGVSVGRVMRAADPGLFSRASGLDGRNSDWLVATGVTLDDRLSLSARGLFADDFSVTRAETRISWVSERLDLASSYSWILPDAAENRPDLTSQLVLSSGYRFTRYWKGTLEMRYDFAANRATRAGLGLSYRNECIGLDLSLSRRYTSSTSVRPTTDFNLAVSINGFGNDGRAYRRPCAAQ